MKILNKHNLPETLVNVTSKVYKPLPDRISVSQLINAPLVRYLTIKFWDSLEEDVSDRLWAILGTAMHHILKTGTPEDAFGEEKLTHKIGEITIVGKSDLYDNGEISDWKITSVYSFLLGIKAEWEAQLNIYKWLWEKNGFEVNSLKIHAILRDWVKRKAKYDSKYPQIPFFSVNIPVWDATKITEYISNRIALHFTAPISECTPEEKWQRPTSWAIIKGNNVRATRVLDTEKEAEEYMERLGDKRKDFSIKERKGEDVRCESYCLVSRFCNYYKKEE